MRRSWFFAATSTLTLLCIIVAAIGIARSQQEPAAPVIEAPPPPEPAPQAAAPADPVLELFNPSTATLSDQLNASALKNRLEELAILAFVLRRCEIISATEYNDTFQAMGIFVQRMQPAQPELWDRTIATAIESASATYGLLYARNECKPMQLRASAMQLAQWRAALLQ